MNKINWKFTATTLFILLTLILGIFLGKLFSTPSESNNAPSGFGQKVETKNLKKCESLGQITRSGPFEIMFCVKVDDSDNLYLTNKITDMPDLSAYFYCTHNALYRTMNVVDVPENSQNYDSLFGPIDINGYHKSGLAYGYFFGTFRNLKPEILQVPRERDLLTGYIARNPEESFLKTDLIKNEQLLNESSELFNLIVNSENPRPDLREEYLKVEEDSKRISEKIGLDCVLVSDKLKEKNGFPDQNNFISNFGNLFYEDFAPLVN
jgi:hypothetical protein